MKKKHEEKEKEECMHFLKLFIKKKKYKPL